MKYSPLPPIILDKRNEIALATQMAETVKKASGGKITEVGPDSVVYMLSQGLAFGIAELLYYGSRAPEAWTIEFLRTMGFMRMRGRKALVTLVFTRSDVSRSQTIKAGFRVRTKGGLAFQTLYHVIFQKGQTSQSVLAEALEIGVKYNVKAKSLTTPSVSLNMKVTNPGPAIGGLNAETYKDTKNRAFNAIRKNLTFFDFQVAISQLLGSSNIIRVEGSTPRLHKFDKANINAPYSYNAEEFFNQLRLYQKALNESYEVENWMIDRYAQFQKELYHERKIYNYYTLDPSNNCFGTEVLASVRDALKGRVPAGGELFIENARINLVNILIYTENPNLSSRYVTAFETRLRNLFINMGLNSDLEYNDVVSALEGVYPVVSVKITYTSTVSDLGLPSEQRSPMIRATLGREGLLLNSEFSTLSKIPNPAFGSAWKLNTLTLENIDKEAITYGNLIRCIGTTAERADTHGGTYFVEEDKACIF